MEREFLETQLGFSGSPYLIKLFGDFRFRTSPSCKIIF
jgi:hypothetical protein